MTKVSAIFSCTLTMVSFVLLYGGFSIAFGAGGGIPACSNSFAKSLNKDNTVMWVNDPNLTAPHSCCDNGRVCQPYPKYKNYVVAMPRLQSEYDCERIAKGCGYTPLCKIAVGEALDPTTVCTSCVPYRHTFWATVYQNNNPE